VAQDAPSVASGLVPRSLAAGPAHYRHYSDYGGYVKQTPKNSDRARPRAHRADSSPAAGPVCRETCPRWSI